MAEIPEWLRRYENESLNPEPPDEGHCPLTGKDCPTDEREVAKCRAC